MRGDQLSRQWRTIRASEASLNGLTVTEIAQREETGIHTIYRDLEVLYPRYHAKAQRAPSEIFKILFPPLKIFLLLQHSRTILCVLGALARDKMSRKAAKFAKKTVLHLPALNTYLVRSLARVSQLGKGPLRPLRLGVRYDLRLAPFDLRLFLC
jgi:hypothetical protein